MEKTRSMADNFDCAGCDDSLVLCRNLREKSNTPVIMVTARVDEMARNMGLEMGADDFFPKPFNPRGSMARLKNLQS